MRFFTIALAALTLTTTSAFAQSDYSLTDYSSEVGLFTIQNSGLDTLFSFELSISEIDFDVALNIDENFLLPFMSNVAFTDVVLAPGESLTLPTPLTWNRWVSHGMFSHVNNEYAVSILSYNDSGYWLNSDDYLDVNFDDNYLFLQGVVTENVVVIAEETIVVVTNGVTDVTEALVTFPTVVNQNGTLSFNHTGVADFQFVLSNLSGQQVYYTTNVNEMFDLSALPTGVYAWGMQLSTSSGAANAAGGKLYVQN